MSVGLTGGGSIQVPWSPPRWAPDSRRARIATAAALALALLIPVSGLQPWSFPSAVDGATSSTSPLTADDTASLAEQVKAAQLHFHPRADGSFAVSNPGAGISATLSGDKLAVQATDAGRAVTLESTRFGRAGHLVPLAAAVPTATDVTATLVRGPVVEWFRNREGGLEQGWTIPSSPRGHGNLILDLAVSGAAVQVLGDRSARFIQEKSVISYDGLRVNDSTGRTIPAHFREVAHGLRVVVDDAKADYPLVIDPVLSTTGELEAPPNRAMDNFGYSVDIQGRWMIVGAYGDDLYPGAPIPQSGSVTTYFDDTGNGDWRRLGRLQPNPTPVGVTAVGFDVALDVEPSGITIVAGALAGGRVVYWTYAGDPITTAPNAVPSAPTVLVPQAGSGYSVGQYGWSVDIDDGAIVVGAPLTTRGGLCAPDNGDPDTLPQSVNERIGSVDVFRRPGAFGTAYAMSQRLLPLNDSSQADPANRDAFQEFGDSVAIRGDLLAVGAPGDDGQITQTYGTCAAPADSGTSRYQGAVHTYRYQGGTWTKQQLVVPSTRRDDGKFGDSVALAPDGDLLVGESGGVGRAYLYDHSQVVQIGIQDSWSDERSLNGDNPATPAVEPNTGGAWGEYVRFDDTGRWMAVSGTRYNVTGLGNIGSALVFERPGTGPGDVPVFRQWIPGATSADSFSGRGLAIDGTTLLYGSLWTGNEGHFAGRVQVYRRSGSTYQPTQDLKNVGDRFEDRFGTVIARDGDWLAVAAPFDRRSANRERGTVLVFHNVSGAWVFEQSLHHNTGTARVTEPALWVESLDLWVRKDASGNEIGLYVAVGTPQASTVDRDGRGDPFGYEPVGTNAGNVTVYGRPGVPGTAWMSFQAQLWAGGHQSWQRAGIYDPATITPGGKFGTSVAFTDDGTLVVGEPGAAGGNGQLHRFDRTGTAESLGGSPSYTFRETIAGSTTGTALGRTMVADGQHVEVASTASNGNIRVSRYDDPSATGALTAGPRFQVGLSAQGTISIDSANGRIALGSVDSNAARIYRAPTASSPQVLEAEFNGVPDNAFGSAIALNRGGSTATVLVGAPSSGPSATMSGTATAYVAKVKADGSATWSEAATLAPPAATPTIAEFGTSLLNYSSAGGAMVGAPGYDVPNPSRGRVFTYTTTALSPPPGPTAFVDVTTPGTVPVGASYIPTAGLAPSLLTNNAQQSGSIAAASIGGIDLSLPPEGTSVAASPLSTIPITPLLDSASEAITSIRLSDLGLTRPGGWPALLAGTSFDGVPLQSITLKDVANIPAVRQLTWADISVAASPLSTIPLSTIALGAVPLSTIDLGGSGSSIEQWCTQLNAAGFDPALAGLNCDNPGAASNAGVTIVSLALAGAPLSTIPLSTIPLSTIPLSTIPLSTIPLSTIDLAGSPLSTIPLSTIPLSTIPLSTIPLSTIPLSTIPLSTIPLSTIDLAGTPLSTIPLSTIALAGTPLSTIPLSTIPLSTIPLSTIPLSTIPLSTIPLSTIPLSTIDLDASPLSTIPLSTIPLSTIDLAGSPLSTIPLSTIPLSTIPLSTIPLSTIPLSTIPLSTIPLSTISLSGSPLSTIPLSTIDLIGSPLSTIPLSTIPLSTIASVVDCDLVSCSDPQVTLGDAARAGALKSDGRLGGLEGALAGIHYGDLLEALTGYSADDFRNALNGRTLADIQDFDDLALGDVPQIWAYLTLGGLGNALKGFRLGDIANRIDGYTSNDVRDALGTRTLADLTGFDDVTIGELPTVHQYLNVGHLNGLLDTIRLGDLVGIINKSGGGTYSAADLRTALTQAMGANATLEDLGPDFDDLTLGELADYGATTIGQLLSALEQDVLERITLGDLLLTLIARSQYPWEDLNLDNALSQSLDATEQSVPVSVAFQADAPDGHARDVQVTVQPPAGSAMVPGSAALTLPGHAGELTPEVVDGALVWTFSGVPAGAVHTLTFDLEPTVRIGVNELVATATLLADDVSAEDTAGMTVAEVIEPNDTPATAAALPADTIVLSHISSGSDIDLFKFTVSQVNTKISLVMSNLDADLDMVLYGPKASSAGIQGQSDRSIVPVEDEAAGAVPVHDETAPVPDNDIATPASLGDLAVHARSIHRRTHDEQIDATLATAGTYYLAVSGYNGVTNRQPYALRLKKLGTTTLGACPTRSVTPGAVTGSLPAQLPAGTNTVFLLNQSRLAGLFDATRATAVRTGVDQLVSYVNSNAELGVKAAVLPIDADAGVRSAYTAWDASPCDPNQANAVAAQIVRVLDTYRDAGAKLKHIVVVGGDDAVPFARVPDKTEIANERGYASTFSDARHALSSSLTGSYVQTDDAYGDVDPYGFGDRVLFVPDAAVGRLVETPVEITDQLGDFVAAGGKLNVSTGLVTGYDFLSDGANAAADAADPTYGTINRSLISDTWTRSDLENAIHSIKPDLAGINAHFDHFRALPGLGNSTGDESDLFTAAAVRGALAEDFAGAITFSMGCHSGLSASDLVVSGDRGLDFAQAISSQGGVFVGNTGYGYGDTELVALSERLMTGFSGRLDGALSVGEALQYAKAEYAADLTAYGVYDEKAMMEATLYGLPFYRLNVANPPPVPPLPAAPLISNDPISGIDTSTIQVTPVTDEREGEDGSTFWVGIGEGNTEMTTEVHDRPVQPRDEASFTAPAGKEAHDALVLGMTTTDLHGIEPHVLEPVVDGAGERSDAPAEVAFPSSPVRVNPELTPAGETFSMTVTTGYFRTTAADGSGIQRLVDAMTVTPYFVSDANTDFTRPTFQRVDATVDGGVLTLAIDVVDDQGGPERIKRVHVLVVGDPAHGSSSTWQAVDLVRTVGSRWTGSIPVTGEQIEYVVQAVDAAGNVGVTANKALNFRDEALVTTPPAPTLRLKLAGTEGNAGWYTGPVTFTATGGTNITYEVVGELDERPYTGPITVSPDGPHTVIVRSGDGQEVARTVKIDTHGPIAVVSAPVNGAVIAGDSGATAQYSCLDAGSGTTSCTGTLTVRTGYGTTGGTDEPVANGADITTRDGRHTLTVSTGPDVAGNAPQTATGSTTFSVVPPPRIDSLSLPGSHNGNTRSVGAAWTGVPLAGPFTTKWEWGDGTTTSCATGQTTSSCSSSITSGGAGTSLATHTYPAITERDVFVTVTDAIGQKGTASISFNKTTVMVAKPALVTISFASVTIAPGGVGATLTTPDGVPLVGRTITFTAGNGTALCTATTGSDGKASCGKLVIPLLAFLSGSYTATFAGDSVYVKVNTTAQMLKLL